MSLARVVAAWKAGESLREGFLHTDGHDICSWILRIGRTSGGEKVAIDYRGQLDDRCPREVGNSRAAALHCTLVIAAADRIEAPSKNRERAYRHKVERRGTR